MFYQFCIIVEVLQTKIHAPRAVLYSV